MIKIYSRFVLNTSVSESGFFIK